jgi:DoxX-like family
LKSVGRVNPFLNGTMLMQAEISTASPSKSALWGGRILTGFAVLFLVVDGIGKILKIAPVLEACAPLEIPEWVIPGLGATLIAATLIHTIPQTSVLGAILLTGYLGGATWTHVRMGGPIFPVIFPSLVGALIWGGLYLRDPRLRVLVPFRRSVD